MKKFRYLLLALILPLAACGPIISYSMMISEGVQDSKVIIGDLADLSPGSKMLVVGPFTKDPTKAYYTCRGEEALAFSDTFKKEELFKSSFYYDDNYPDAKRRLSGKSGAQIQAAMNLDDAPDFLLTGHIRHKNSHVVLLRGVITKVGYTLRFENLKTGQVSIFEIDVKDETANCIPMVVKDLTSKIQKKS